jgi:hypothetical protein
MENEPPLYSQAALSTASGFFVVTPRTATRIQREGSMARPMNYTRANGNLASGSPSANSIRTVTCMLPSTPPSSPN